MNFRKRYSLSTLRSTFVNLTGMGVYLLMVLGPMLAMMVQTLRLFAEDGSNATELLHLAIPTGRRAILLGRTLLYAFSVALTCTVAGAFGGSLLWTWRDRKARALRWLLLILAPLPPYIHGLAWSSLVMALNRMLRQAGLLEIAFRGWAASWWVQTMAMLPAAVGFGLIGFLLIDREQLEAARLESSNGRWLLNVAFPLAAPVLAAAAAAVFILSLIDYSVPSLFQMNVYSLEIFADFSATGEPVRAFMLGLPLWLPAVLILGLVLWGKREWSFNAGRVDNYPGGALRLPGWIGTLQWASLVLLLMHVLVPLISQVLLVRTPGIMLRAVSEAADEIRTSLLIACGAVLVSLPVIFMAGKNLLGRNRVMWLLYVLAPITLPASLVGIGLVSLWNSMIDIGVYGTVLMPILAAAARFIPFAILAAAAQMATVQEELLDSARIYQKNTLQRILKIDIPLYAPGLAAAAALIFVLTIGELGATLIVSPPGRGTLTMRIYNYLHYGASDTVAGLCLAITLLTVLFGLAAVFLYQGVKKEAETQESM